MGFLLERRREQKKKIQKVNLLGEVDFCKCGDQSELNLNAIKEKKARQKEDAKYYRHMAKINKYKEQIDREENAIEREREKAIYESRRNTMRGAGWFWFFGN